MLVLIDNYDSFTYNVYHYFTELNAKIKVLRNDKTTIKEVKDLKEYFEESMGKINDRLEEIEKKAERNESNLIIISSTFLIIYSLNDLIGLIIKKKYFDFSRVISHLGFGFLVFFIGVNHVYSVKEDFNLKIGEEKKLNNYKINFKSLQVKEEKNYKTIIGNFYIISSKDNSEKKLNPEIRVYNNPQTLTYEASIKSTIFSDIYLTMSNISRSDYYNIKFQVKPFMIWIWLSAITISIGGFLRIFKKT